MAIPDFQTIMLPLMRHLQDGRDHTRAYLVGIKRHATLPVCVQARLSACYLSAPRPARQADPHRQAQAGPVCSPTQPKARGVLCTNTLTAA